MALRYHCCALVLHQLPLSLSNPPSSRITCEGLAQKPYFPLRCGVALLPRLLFPMEFKCGFPLLLKGRGARPAFSKATLSKLPTALSMVSSCMCSHLGAGHLVIQVAVSRWTKNFLRRNSFPRITQNPYWDNLATPFWPSNGTPVLWPPPKHLSDEMIDTFCCRWRNVTVPATPFRAIRFLTERSKNASLRLFTLRQADQQHVE